jgi:3-phosphoshikimate 1-carboxyvinyltransferase
MALPDLIEIVPAAPGARCLVTIPGSKSITNRALILAALAEGETALRGALWSDDTEVMVEALRTLGFAVGVEADASEPANCSITVEGLGGRIPNAGTASRPLEIFVGNAGTVARFLMAMLCLGDGVYRVTGVPRMHERPQGALFEALRELGYDVTAEGGWLPATIRGEAGARGTECTVSIEESSQFASALLLSSRVGGWRVKIVGEDAEESAYVAMTSKLIEVFPQHGGEYQIEPDCSSAVYFQVAGALVPDTRVAIAAWPESDWQIDGRFIDYLGRLQDARSEAPYADVSRIRDLGDAIMMAIAMAPLLPRPSRFIDLGRLRVQESERVHALRTELTKCGADVVEAGDTLTIRPSTLSGAEIETYDDHRVAMCFSALGVAVSGIRIRNPACVSKTFPNFYAKLAEPPPNGLGVHVLDARTGRGLSGDELLA